MTTLHQLWDEHRQSPWLDYLDRSIIDNGELTRLIGAGVRGVTTNPAIFDQALRTSDRYDPSIGDLIIAGRTPEEAYWELIVIDVKAACRHLRPLFEASDAGDGYVSIEVAPALAHDADATVASGVELWKAVGEPNLMIKVPGTAAGCVAVRQLTAQAINVNVTLLFGLAQYRAVAAAYLDGLTDRHHAELSIDRVVSVASFFLSRVDAAVDAQLAHVRPGPEDHLVARTAIAQAVLAWDQQQRDLASERWKRLASQGAKPQRLLWASTSVKTPTRSDTMYVEPLIGPHTVTTLPTETLEAFLDHGSVARTLGPGDDMDAAHTHLAALVERGIDLGQVADDLQNDGLTSFACRYEQSIEAIRDKMQSLPRKR